MKALITGATSGIGKEIALVLAAKDIELVIASRDEIAMAELKELLNNKISVDFIQIDLSKEKSAKSLYETVIKRGHKIDILVNNSGFGLYGQTVNLDPELLEEMIILNCATLTTLSRLFGKDMTLRGSGYILNVASTASYQPIPNFAVYSATKSFVMSFSRALHHELKRFGVRVTCLNPGPTETNFHKTALGGVRFKLFKGKPKMSANDVAVIGINAMFAGKSVVTAGLLNKIFSIILPLIPLSFVESFLRKNMKF